MQRVFLAGRSARLRALGGGAWIRLHARNGFAPDRKTPPRIGEISEISASERRFQIFCQLWRLFTKQHEPILVQKVEKI